MAFFAKQFRHGMVPRQRGGAAIEMILVFPIMLLLLYAAVSYAILFWAYQGLNSVTSELAGQVIRQEWYEVSEGDYTLKMDEINDTLDLLLASNSGPVVKAKWCSGYPAISDDAGVGRLSVCLEVDEGLLPQISLLGFEVPHQSSISVTALLRVSQ